MNDQRPDPREEDQGITIAQAAQLLDTTKQTIRNHMSPHEAIRRPWKGQERIYLTPETVERIREELRQSGTEKRPESAATLAGNSPESTDKLPDNDQQTTAYRREIDRQAAEIEWLRARLEDQERQLAAKDQQIAAAQQLADQAQKLQLIAERRLIAAGIDPDTDPAADQATAPAPMEELREELEELRAQVAAAQAAQDQQKRRSFWDIFRRR